MELEEFKNYIKNQRPLDPIDIGLKFKELPVKQRSWKWLLDYLTDNDLLPESYEGMSPDAFRKRVSRYSQPQKFYGDAEAIEYRKEYSDKQKVRDWYNAYRRNIREQVRIDNLVEEIQAAADKFSSLPKVIYKDNEMVCDKEATLLLSDLHIGVDCDNYYNKYNKDIALHRLNVLARRTITYCKLNNVKQLDILNLGDMIQGLIHTNARIEAQMDVAEQIIIAGEYLSSFLNTLQEAAPVITYRSVYDNHSRAIADKNEHVEKEQFSRIIDWFIKERLKDTSIKFIRNEIDGGIGSLEVFGKKILFAHGHQDSKTASMQNFVGLTREWIDYIFLAHYHKAAVEEFQGCKVFINGSIVGTEQYAFGKRLFSPPSQKLLIFEKNCDSIIDIDISLNN